MNSMSKRINSLQENLHESFSKFFDEPVDIL